MTSAAKDNMSSEAKQQGRRETVTFRRQLRSLTIYLFILVLAKALVTISADPFWQSLGLGLMLPGGGFLNAIMLDGAQSGYALLMAGFCLFGFVVALFLWFATGNALAPPLVWLGTALLPLLFQDSLPFLADMLICSSNLEAGALPKRLPPPMDVYLVLPSLMTALVIMSLAMVFYREWQRQQRLNQGVVIEDTPTTLPQTGQGSLKSEGRNQDDELSLQDLQRVRLLLDRALQPVDEFEGFEWRDQFQTASMRFQVNALSYALSMTQFNKTPAFTGYLTLAQHNLARKMLDHRVWGYWQLENLWGNLNTNPDPVAKDTNIMLTGFYGLQLSMFQAASGISDYNKKDALAFVHPKGQSYQYDQPQFMQVLAAGHKNSAFGLMPCEPNWIYPLCNIMSAASMSMHDRQFGTAYWQEIETIFSQGLERDFLAPNGEFITLLSTYTGLSLSHIGGAIMQAFPLLFLGQILPEMAQHHWARLRSDLLSRKDMRKAFWPVDVGNYGFSRGAGYVAGAATAVEMGDGAVAQSLFGFLEQEHPTKVVDGVAQRQGLSLWAHCYEVLARSGGAGAFAALGDGNPESLYFKPHIAKASYPEVLVAKAVEHQGRLKAVLYPGKAAGQQEITVHGLGTGRDYLCQVRAAGQTSTHSFQADMRGRAILNILLDGRTELKICKTA